MLFFPPKKKPQLSFTNPALPGLHLAADTHGSEDEYIQLLDKKTGIERVLQGLVFFLDRKKIRKHLPSQMWTGWERFR